MPKATSQPLNLAAQPFAFCCDVATTALIIIDMQRDFVEPGGFGETLGNDVSLLSAIVPACQRVLGAWRQAGGVVVHTREAHRADLSNCPSAHLPNAIGAIHGCASGMWDRWGVFW